MIAIAVTETTNDAIIELISLQALMRHQYQRRISTSPVPEPSARRNRHAAAIVPSCIVTKMDRKNRSTVADRPIAT